MLYKDNVKFIYINKMSAIILKNLNKAIMKVIDDVQTATLDKVYEFAKELEKDEATFNAAFEEFKRLSKWMP